MLKTQSLWFSRLTLTIIALVSAFTLAVGEADAKRFGGGKSFGRQSSNVSKQYNQTPAATPSAPQAAPSAPQAPQRNRWLGPLAGIAAGLGLAALLSHFGMSGDFAGILLILLLVGAGFFLWSMLRRTQARPAQQGPAYAGASSAPQTTHYAPAPESSLPGGATNSVMASFEQAASWGIPPGFDKEGFERTAKVHFIRLQAAWDARDLADIREFTTPEMYAEVKMQLSEAGAEKSVTEVVDLSAELLGLENGAQDDLASVRFKGRVRESQGGELQDLEEVWNLMKPHNGRTGWLLAGIQQVR